MMNTLTLLEQHIRSRLGNDVENLDFVLEHFQPQRVKRREFLLRNGEICRYCYFVAKGCIQNFVYDKEGNITTRDFIFENNWVTEIQSFSTQQPAMENLRAVEPADVLAIDFASFQKLVATIPQFERVYRQIMERSYANSVYRINTFISMDALERLKWTMEHQPRLLTRLSNRMVASYLGISPETLSRLKAKL